MKKLILLFFVGALCGPAGSAGAQEFLAPPAGTPNGLPTAAGPPRMELPGQPSADSGAMYGGDSPGMQLMPEPIPTGDLTGGDLQPGLQPLAAGGDYQNFNCDPAILESTGTWLRRGFWYTEIDILLMDLIWRRDDLPIAFQFFNQTGSVNNALLIQGGRNGAELMPRIKLGRFLFRDLENRDHTMEAIISGGTQWTRSGRLDAVDGGILTVSPQLAGGNPSFTGATSSQFEYDTRFNNFELNYHVRSRMDKDRMELEPSGQWVRRAQPSSSFSLMAGIRYFDLTENMAWDAFGIDDDGNSATAAQTGAYRVRADNDLIGSQLGISWGYEAARWSLGLQTKSGTYLNRTDVNSLLNITGDIASGQSNVQVNNLSFLTEAGLIAKWHLSPNFSLRTGAEVLYVSSIAHASEQLNFTPVSTSASVVESGNATFMGATIGFEGYW